MGGVHTHSPTLLVKQEDAERRPREGENAPPGDRQPAPGHAAPSQWPGWSRRLLTVRLTDTPTTSTLAQPPVSCPSRLQHSPARPGRGAFDPFAAPAENELPGCTPMCAQLAAAPPAPPAVHRKPLAAEGSPVLAARPAAPFPADRVQSCPPERVGRRGTRPLLRVRVKRSLNGAVAAAGCTTASTLARRSLDAPPAASAQQLAGISRKRLEAELLSPPLPRKSSRTLLDGEHAADMLARLHLAGPASGAPDGAH